MLWLPFAAPLRRRAGGERSAIRDRGADLARGGFRLWCRPHGKASRQSVAGADAFAGCRRRGRVFSFSFFCSSPAASRNTKRRQLHPNPILIREFAVSPGIVTLDPSFGFSLYRGERGVPREQRAAGLGRAVAFNLTDAMAEYLTGLGYDVLRSETGAVEPGMRALVVSGSFRRIDEGQRRRVGGGEQRRRGRCRDRLSGLRTGAAAATALPARFAAGRRRSDRRIGATRGAT